jgi:hypothetical protein
MRLLEELKGRRLVKILALEEMRGLKPKIYLKKLDIELPDILKKAICHYGYNQIDSEEERKKVADIILKKLEKLIPPEYKPLWPIIKPVINIIILELLNKAAEKGAAFCKGVSYTISPL